MLVCVLAVVSVLVTLSSAASLTDSTNSKTSFLAQRYGALSQPVSAERKMVNRVLTRILDLTYEMFRELGANEGELKELHHKRSVIQACYFQAISCY